MTWTGLPCRCFQIFADDASCLQRTQRGVGHVQRLVCRYTTLAPASQLWIYALVSQEATCPNGLVFVFVSHVQSYCTTSHPTASLVRKGASLPTPSSRIVQLVDHDLWTFVPPMSPAFAPVGPCSMRRTSLRYRFPSLPGLRRGTSLACARSLSRQVHSSGMHSLPIAAQYTAYAAHRRPFCQPLCLCRAQTLSMSRTHTGIERQEWGVGDASERHEVWSESKKNLYC